MKLKQLLVEDKGTPKKVTLDTMKYPFYLFHKKETVISNSKELVEFFDLAELVNIIDVGEITYNNKVLKIYKITYRYDDGDTDGESYGELAHDDSFYICFDNPLKYNIVWKSEEELDGLDPLDVIVSDYVLPFSKNTARLLPDHPQLEPVLTFLIKYTKQTLPDDINLWEPYREY